MKYVPKIDHFYNTFKRLIAFPNCRCRWGVRNVFMVCEFDVVSRYSNKKYIICLNYEKGFSPRLWVVEPDFMMHSRLPHVYANNRLCLYHPDNFTWTRDKDIVQTLMFWAAAWIEFYEMWAETGVWLGPEAEHKQETAKIETPNNKTKTSCFPLHLKDTPIRY